MRVTLKAMTYFLTTVDRGSISQAAEELNVVPSAVSSAIDMMEEEFAVQLVLRYRARGIEPTAAGRILAGKIRHLLDEYANLMIEGGDLGTALTGTLRIGYYAPVAPAFMPQIVAPLMQSNPGLTVAFEECDNDTAQAGLLSGGFDAILFVAENVRPGIDHELLIEVPAYVLIGADHPLAKRKSLKLSDLAGLPSVLLDLPVARDYYRSILEDAGLEPRVAASATTTEMVRSLVGAGAGHAILNMRPLTDVSYGGDRLAAVPISPAVKPLRLVLGHVAGNPRRLVRAFVEQCRVFFVSEAARRTIVGL